MKATKTTHIIGIDLGDKSHETCTLDAEGSVVDRSTVLNNRETLISFRKDNRGATLIMEAGCSLTDLRQEEKT